MAAAATFRKKVVKLFNMCNKFNRNIHIHIW